LGIIRLLLALLVVLDHSRAFPSLELPGGPFAVKVFFIISGFYMTLILTKKYTGKGSYNLFITNRFLRLYPIYWFVVGLTIFFSIGSYLIYGSWLRLVPYVAYNEYMNFPTIGFLGLTNLILFGQDLVMFLGLNLDTGGMFLTSNFVNTHPQFHEFLLIPQAWTVGMELLFYLVAPFIVTRKLRFVTLLIAISILSRIYIYFVLGMQHDPWTYRFFPNELALFLIGTVSYHIYKYIRKNPINKNINKMIFIVYMFVLIFYNQLPAINSILDIKSVLFYTLTGLSIPSIFLLTKSSNIDNRIGDLSYPIYLVHMLIIYVASLVIKEFGLNIHKGIVVVVLTIITSYLLVRYISDPIEKYRQSRVTH
jgi:peptidoglycan/LPS O-acetylase OafA/YrhL